MHSCPPGYAVTGIHVAANLLACEGTQELWAQPNPIHDAYLRDEQIDAAPSDHQTPFTNGRTAHWCGPGRVVTGIHEGENKFACSRFAGLVEPDGREVNSLGEYRWDGAPGRPATQRVVDGVEMHTCPTGFVLAGAYFAENAFYCVERLYCGTSGSPDPGCVGTKTCRAVIPPSGSDPVVNRTGICR
jgi:hypothetical protein